MSDGAIRLQVGDTFRSHLALSRGETFTVEQVGRNEVKLSGIWMRRSQIKRWVREGNLVPESTSQEAREGEGVRNEQE